MKYLFSIFLFLIFNNISLFSQDKTQYILKMDSSLGKSILSIRKYDGFYIDTIIDKRIKKSSNLGLLTKQGVLFSRLVWAKFESDLVAHELNKICNMFLKKNVNKVPIIAELKNIQVSENKPTIYVGTYHTILEIDFYRKDENNNLKLVGHYHGKFTKYAYGETPMSIPEETLCYALQKALNTIDISEDKKFSHTKVSPEDTTYVPKKGFYYSYLDYLYNTPFGLNSKVELKQDENLRGEKIWRLRCKNDSIVNGIASTSFGYSDGAQFYTYSTKPLFQGRNCYNFQKISSKGRFLLMKEVQVSFTNSAKKANELGLYVKDLVHDKVSLCDVIVDMATGETIRVNSDYFLFIIEEIDENLLRDYIKTRGNYEDTVVLINKINSIFYSKMKSN